MEWQEKNDRKGEEGGRCGQVRERRRVIQNKYNLVFCYNTEIQPKQINADDVRILIGHILDILPYKFNLFILEKKWR